MSKPDIRDELRHQATEPLLPSHLLAGVPLDQLATSEFARHPIGSGPFALTEIDGSHATLTPAALLGSLVPGASAGDTSPAPTPTSVDSLATPPASALPSAATPYIERIEVQFYPDDAAAAAAFRAGDIDGVAGLAPDVAQPLAGEPGVTRQRYPTTTLATVLLNLRATHPELRDVRVRRALLGAIDRDSLVTDVLGGDAVRADTLVPPASWAFDAESAAPVAYDTKAAAKLLDAAGWTRTAGKWVAPGARSPYQLELLSVPADANPRLAALAGAVADAWRSFGMDVTVVELPAAELATRLREGKFAASVLDITTGLEPDLYPLLASTQVRGTGGNLSGYQDPALDALLDAARKPGTDAARAAAWRALLAGIAAREPLLPLAWTSESVLSRGVEGASPRLISDVGDRFWDVLAWRLAADR